MELVCLTSHIQKRSLVVIKIIYHDFNDTKNNGEVVLLAINLTLKPSKSVEF